MTSLWRITINPDAEATSDPREFCLKQGYCGVGWSVETDATSLDWETYYQLGEKQYYYKDDRGWWPAIHALHDRMEIDDLCWTRDHSGTYHLGRITGPWQYVKLPGSYENDIYNLRTCEWQKIGKEDDVPGAVVRSLMRGRTIQQVHDETALVYSQNLFNEIIEKIHYHLVEHSSDLFSLLSPDDLEDVVGLYLQARGYLILPSTCKRSTQAYEFVLIHKDTGERATIQVKSGHTGVDLSSFADDSEILFAGTGKNQITSCLEI